MGKGIESHGIRVGQVWRRKRDGRRVRVTDFQAASGYVWLWWPNLPHGCIPAKGRETWKRVTLFVRDFTPTEEQ